MSDTTGVKVNISADSSGYTDAVENAQVTAASFADALRAVGNDLRKITPEMLGMGGAADKMAEAIFNATAGAQQASVTLSSLSTAGQTANTALKSAADSADFFLSKLNPTPLQTLRRLMAEDNPSAAKIFGGALGDLSQRGSLTANTLQQNIDAANKIGPAFNSARDSAAFFSREINRIPLAELRSSLVSVASTGDVTFRSLQENINAANRISPAFNSAAESARFFEASLNPTPLQTMRKLMDTEVPSAAHASSGAMSGLTREFVVLGHEAINGNWTRIPGSLLVLSEYAGGARTALFSMITSFTTLQTIGVASLAAVAAGFVAMAVEAYRATRAINEATSAATMQGRSPAEAREAMKGYVEQLRQTGVMGQSAMTQVASSISQLGELTEAQRSKIASVGTALFLNWDRDAKKTGEELSRIFESTGSLDAYLQKQHLLSTDQQVAWSRATTAAEKYDIGISAITARLGPMNAAIKTAQETSDMAQANLMLGMPITSGPESLSGPKNLGDFEPGTKAADPQAASDTEAVIKLNTHNQERLDIEARLAAAKRDLTRATEAGNTAEQALAQTAIGEAQNQLAMWRAMGDTTWEGKQQAALNSILTGLAAHATSSKQLAMDENRARMEFWDAAQTKSGLTEGQITTARANAARARIALSKEELRGAEGDAASWIAKQQAVLGERLVAVAANAKSSRALAEDENRERIRFWDEAAKEAGLSEKQIIAARAEANRARLALAGEELRGGASAAKQQLAERLTALSTEQAANHDNFAKVMELEDQKIALLRAAGAEETKQLNEELAKQINMRRQHTLQVIAEQERELTSQRSQHTAEIAERRSELDQEVSERRISKAEEMAALRTFSDEKHALDLQALDQLLATIDPQTEAYRKLYDDITKLKQQWLAQDRKLNAEATADLKRQWDAATAPISQAIDSQVSAMMRGTQTIGQSVAGMAQNVVADYAKMGIKAATNWASSQLMQLAIARGTETAKNTIVAAGAATRTGIANSETAGQSAGLIVQLGKWIATQLGMTTATTTGAGAREAALSAEQIASIQATGAAARLSIAAAAAVAAAWAFADSAMLGPVGLAAAPAAAAGAEASVMAWQGAVPSLDVGAWNVPKDMGANLHAGEMVVPANFASGLRGTINGSKGGDMNLNYSPTVNGGGTDTNSLMRNQAGMIKSYLWHATRNGALRLPGR